MKSETEIRPPSIVAGPDEVSRPLPAPPAAGAGPGPDEERPLLISPETLLRLI